MFARTDVCHNATSRQQSEGPPVSTRKGDLRPHHTSPCTGGIHYMFPSPANAHLTIRTGPQHHRPRALGEVEFRRLLGEGGR